MQTSAYSDGFCLFCLSRTLMSTRAIVSIVKKKRQYELAPSLPTTLQITVVKRCEGRQRVVLVQEPKWYHKKQ